jgi:hypothetical protein
MFFWIKSSCGLVGRSQHFWEACCLHIQGWSRGRENLKSHKIKTVKNFECMESIIQGNLWSQGEIENRISEKRNAINMLNSVLWSRNILRERNKLKYKTIIKRILTYGAETWTLKQKHKNKLLAIDTDYPRRSARTSGMENIRNETIKRKMEFKNDALKEIEE